MLLPALCILMWNQVDEEWMHRSSDVGGRVLSDVVGVCGADVYGCCVRYVAVVAVVESCVAEFAVVKCLQEINKICI